MTDVVMIKARVIVKKGDDSTLFTDTEIAHNDQASIAWAEQCAQHVIMDRMLKQDLLFGCAIGPFTSEVIPCELPETFVTSAWAPLADER